MWNSIQNNFNLEFNHHDPNYKYNIIIAHPHIIYTTAVYIFPVVQPQPIKYWILFTTNVTCNCCTIPGSLLEGRKLSQILRLPLLYYLQMSEESRNKQPWTRPPKSSADLRTTAIETTLQTTGRDRHRQARDRQETGREQPDRPWYFQVSALRNNTTTMQWMIIIHT